MNSPTAAKPAAPASRDRAAAATRSMPPIAMTGSGERAHAARSASSPATGWPAALPADGNTVPNSR